DSVEALQAFRMNPDKFDLVITDMTMPNMSGDMLARGIMQIRADIPIILCTGYSDRMNEEKARSIGIRHFLKNPFAIHDLARTIRSVLTQ
ncbi:MAG: response regulator, partial [bacterium]|nr:response regulator [bacterium]